MFETVLRTITYLGWICWLTDWKCSIVGWKRWVSAIGIQGLFIWSIISKCYITPGYGVSITRQLTARPCKGTSNTHCTSVSSSWPAIQALLPLLTGCAKREVVLTISAKTQFHRPGSGIVYMPTQKIVDDCYKISLEDRGKCNPSVCSLYVDRSYYFPHLGIIVLERKSDSL